MVSLMAAINIRGRERNRRKTKTQGWRDRDGETAELPVFIGCIFSKSKMDFGVYGIDTGSRKCFMIVGRQRWCLDRGI